MAHNTATAASSGTGRREGAPERGRAKRKRAKNRQRKAKKGMGREGRGSFPPTVPVRYM